MKTESSTEPLPAVPPPSPCSEYIFRLHGDGKEIEGKIECENPRDITHAAVSIFSQLMADWDVAGDGGRIEFVIMPNVSDVPRADARPVEETENL